MKLSITQFLKNSFINSPLNMKNLIVIGLGYVGLPLAVNAAQAGYKVFGFDINKDKIKNLKTGITDSPEVGRKDILKLQKRGNLFFTDVIPNLPDKSIFVIAVPTPLNAERKPDIKMLEAACNSISAVIKKGSLVISESTSYIGTLRNFIVPRISQDFDILEIDFAVAPERIDPGNRKWNLRLTPRIIAGLSKVSTDRTFEFYSSFCRNVLIVSSPEVAEATKLFENTFRYVNIALVNEFTEISAKFNISSHEIISAASTKPYGFLPFFPSIGVGGHCIPVDPNYLKFSAELVNLDSKFIDLAEQINLSRPSMVAQSVASLFGGDLINKKIQIVGIAYKPNVTDLRESPALELIKALRSMGAKVKWHDPEVNEWNGEFSSPLDLALDVGLIVAPHDSINLSKWEKAEFKVLNLSTTTLKFEWPKFF